MPAQPNAKAEPFLPREWDGKGDITLAPAKQPRGPFINLAQARAITGLSIRYLAQLCDEGRFRTAHKPGKGTNSHWRVSKAEMQALRSLREDRKPVSSEPDELPSAGATPRPGQAAAQPQPMPRHAPAKSGAKRQAKQFCGLAPLILPISAALLASLIGLRMAG